MEDHCYGANTEAEADTGVSESGQEEVVAATAAAVATPGPEKPSAPQEEEGREVEDSASSGGVLSLFLENQYFVNGTFCCPVCLLRVSTKRHLRIHLEAHQITLNADGTKSIGRQFVKRRDALEPGEPLSCRICKMKLSSHWNLKVHMQRIHVEGARKANQPKELYFCKICHKHLPRKTNVKRHMLSHTDAKPFKCHLCEKSFKSDFSRRSHLLVHTGVRPHKCEECGETFRLQHNLRVHKRRHTKETPYSCQVCQRKFRDAGALYRHKFIHMEVKPYQCSICSHGYTTAQSLKAHLKAHATGTVRIRKRKPVPEPKPGDGSDPSPAKKIAKVSASEAPGAPQEEVRREETEQLPLSSGGKRSFSMLLSASNISSYDGVDITISETQNESIDITPDEDDADDGFADLDGSVNDGPADHMSKSNEVLASGSRAGYDFLSSDVPASISATETSAAVAAIEPDIPEAPSSSPQIVIAQQSFLYVSRNAREVSKPKEVPCRLCGKPFAGESHLRSHLQVHLGSGSTRCQKCRDVLYNEEFDSHECLGDLPKPHVCNVCHKMFADYSEYYKHVSYCSKLKPYQCSHCDRKFTSMAKLEHHALIHSEDRPYRCERCSKRFARHHDLKVHSRIHSTARPFACEYCPKRFRTKTMLSSHVKSHTKERSYFCPYCEKTFSRSSEFNNHVRKHTGEKRHVCSQCGQKFFTKSSLNEHVDTHTSTYLFKCPACPSRFRTAKNLKRHTATHNKVFCYQCPHCDKKYTTKAGLTAHSIRHLPESPYRCETCGKSFASRQRLRSHEAIHSQGDIRYACPVCQRAFPTEASCREHMKVQRDGGFPCSACDAVFCLKRDRHVHEVNDHCKSYVCSVCQRGFRTERWLANHICGAPRPASMHTPHKCPHCPNTYSSTRFLERHLLKHMERREPHPCPVCNKMFVTDYSLESHFKCHPSEEREKFYKVSCTNCGRKFRNMVSLNRHIRHSAVGCGDKEDKKKASKKASPKSTLVSSQTQTGDLEDGSRATPHGSETEDATSDVDGGDLISDGDEEPSGKTDQGLSPLTTQGSSLLSQVSPLPTQVSPLPTQVSSLPAQVSSPSTDASPLPSWMRETGQGRTRRNREKRPEPSTQYQCTTCKDIFDSAEEILAHVPKCVCYQCETCAMTFKSAAEILEHVRSCTPSPSEEMVLQLSYFPDATFKCPHCSEAFADREVCFEHIQLHSRDADGGESSSIPLTPPTQLVLKRHVENIRVLSNEEAKKTKGWSEDYTPVSSPDNLPMTSTDTPTSPAQENVGDGIGDVISKLSLLEKVEGAGGSVTEEDMGHLLKSLPSDSTSPAHQLLKKFVKDLQKLSPGSKIEMTGVGRSAAPVRSLLEKHSENTPVPKTLRASPGSSRRIADKRQCRITGELSPGDKSVQARQNSGGIPAPSSSAAPTGDSSESLPTLQTPRSNRTVASDKGYSDTSASQLQQDQTPKPSSTLSFKCLECQRVFPTLSLMVKHKSLAHPPQANKPARRLPCMICRKEFTSEKELNDEQNHQCALIRKRSGLPVNLVSGKVASVEMSSAGRHLQSLKLKPVLVSAESLPTQTPLSGVPPPLSDSTPSS